MLAFEHRLQYARRKLEQRLSEQSSKGDLVQRASTIERLIAKLDYNFLRAEIPNHVQAEPSDRQPLKEFLHGYT